MRHRLAPILFAALWAAAAPAAETAPREVEGGRLYEIGGYRVLELRGSPEEMGRAHGLLLGATVRRVIDDVLAPRSRFGLWRRVRGGVEVMERWQPERFRREMSALADASGVDYMHVVALQLFGDAERAGRSGHVAIDDPERVQQCTSYAVFGPATEGGSLIVGRNFDFAHGRVAEYASLVIHYVPDEGNAFVTLSWAGVINGWTLMNERGLVAANNTARHETDSLRGVSTCFLQRLIVETCSDVGEAVELARRTPRSCGTSMLVAGAEGQGLPRAVQLEFDHRDFHVRMPNEGYILAANAFREIGLAEPEADRADGSRYGRLFALIARHYGRIHRGMNFAAAPGVPLAGYNLHSAMLFPDTLEFACAMGRDPAYRQPLRWFRMTPEGLVQGEP